MDEISGMGSFEVAKRRFKEGVITNYRERQQEIKDKDGINSQTFYDVFEKFNKTFRSSVNDNDSLYIEDGIVGGKNFFGLKASYNPSEKVQSDTLELSLDSGRFLDKELEKFFDSSVNVGDLSDTELEEFLETFYNMNNGEALNKFGITLPVQTNGEFSGDYEKYAYLFESCLIIDSLLKDKYSLFNRVHYMDIDEQSGDIMINFLSDGTIISVRTSERPIKNNDMDVPEFLNREIAIEKDGKKATVQFTPVSNPEKGESPFYIGEFGTQREEEIALDRGELEAYLRENPGASENMIHQLVYGTDSLDVKDVKYFGDSELITELQQAMEEQFESQRENSREKENTEKPGYQKIIDFMKENGIPDGELFKAVVSKFGRSGLLEKTTQVVIEDLRKIEARQGENNQSLLEDLPDDVIY